MRIASKQQMKRMLAAGEFGNTLRSWASYEEMVASGYRGKVYVRSDLWSAINARMNEVPFEEVLSTLKKHEIDPATCRYFENPPNGQRIIQGEICQQPELFFTYSLLQKPLSDSLHLDPHHASGVAARLILRDYLRPESVEWLDHLLETYQDATIEFTEFRTPQGILNQHLVVWEVRHF